MAAKVRRKVHREPKTTVSRKNQITLPVAAMAEANVEPGDVLKVEVVADGEFRLVRYRDPWLEAFEKLKGSGNVTTAEELEELRNEWER